MSLPPYKIAPLIFTLAALCALSLAGCGKKPSAQAGAPPLPAAAQPAAVPASPPAQNTEAAPAPTAQPLNGPVNQFMTSQLRIFIQQNGRLPKDFAEFARARMDSVPRTPEGMKWAIDRTTREIKLVREK